MEVWQTKDLEVDFAEVWQGKELASCSGDSLKIITREGIGVKNYLCGTYDTLAMLAGLLPLEGRAARRQHCCALTMPSLARIAAIGLEVGGEVYAWDAAAYFFDEAPQIHMICGEFHARPGSPANIRELPARNEIERADVVPGNRSAEAQQIALRDSG